jgi:hypothetical protein
LEDSLFLAGPTKEAIFAGQRLFITVWGQQICFPFVKKSLGTNSLVGAHSTNSAKELSGNLLVLLVISNQTRHIFLLNLDIVGLVLESPGNLFQPLTEIRFVANEIASWDYSFIQPQIFVIPKILFNLIAIKGPISLLHS